jgi:putative ABC transport system ATP-binding protein
MLEEGRIILDLSGKEREDMTVPKLMELYAGRGGKELDTDRMLLTKPVN